MKKTTKVITVKKTARNKNLQNGDRGGFWQQKHNIEDRIIAMIDFKKKEEENNEVSTNEVR